MPEVKVDNAVKSIRSGETSAPSSEGTANECDETLDEEEGTYVVLLKREYVNGHPQRLTQKRRRECGQFLPRLLGEVAAVTDSPLLEFKEVMGTEQGHRSVLGVGVVGFKVYFVNFICVTKGEVVGKDWSVHDIPVTKGIGMDVLLSEPLDMLKGEHLQSSLCNQNAEI